MDRENIWVLAVGMALGIGVVLGLAFAPDNSEALQVVIERAKRSPACESVIQSVISELQMEMEDRHEAAEGFHSYRSRQPYSADLCPTHVDRNASLFACEASDEGSPKSIGSREPLFLLLDRSPIREGDVASSV